MPLIQLDVKMLPMKVHYFLFMGGVAPLTSFLPTIAKQLGYSTVVVGVIYGFLPILSLLTKPIVGAIVDQFRVKKTIFLSFILLTGLSAFALMFVPEIPLETTAEFDCNTATILNVCPKDNSTLSKCDAKRVIEHSLSNEGNVDCELKCLNSDTFRNELCNGWKFDDYCPISTSRVVNKSNEIQSINKFYDEYIYLIASIDMNHTLNDTCFYFRIDSIQLYLNSSEKRTHKPTICINRVISNCQVSCSSGVIMDLLTPETFKGNVLELKQFWLFFLIICLFWMGQAAVYSLGDSICFDQLGEKPNLYGKQRCWGAIGWGFFSIFAGWLLDIFSSSEVNKNYLPIHFLCLLVLLGNFFAASKLKVSETKISTNICKDIVKLLVEVKVFGFLIWTIVFGMCTAMIWNYLFWYIEDVTSMYDCDTQGWMKTLQGFAMGVQCFGGEVPLFFWSGWIIKRLGHLNCMSLVLGVFAFRFFAYSILTNPVWVLAIELASGVNFGLAYAVLMSYASVIALPGTESTMIGLVGGVFEGVGVSLGSLLGGYLYSVIGGAETFRLFAYGSGLMCVIHLLCQNVLKSNGKLSIPSFVGGSTEYASPNEAIHMLSDD